MIQSIGNNFVTFYKHLAPMQT